MRVVITDAEVRLGETVVLQSVSLTFAPGRLTAIAGPSGSGKTTLLAAIAGAVALSSGGIEFFRKDIPVPSSTPRLAWISQSANTLPERTVLDNVSIAGLARGLEVGEANESAVRYLTEFGLGHRLNSTARLLSGGEQQRLAFARALVSDADVILADEPTASLDAANTQRLCDRLRSLSTSRTILVATHDPQMISACDDVVQLGSKGSTP